jgi:hypothetical protein
MGAILAAPISDDRRHLAHRCAPKLPPHQVGQFLPPQSPRSFHAFPPASSGPRLAASPPPHIVRSCTCMNCSAPQESLFFAPRGPSIRLSDASHLAVGYVVAVEAEALAVDVRSDTRA